MDKCYVVGAGPSCRIDRLIDKDRIIIACDVITHLLDEHVKVDYSVTLEDDQTYTLNCYSGQFYHEKPKVIISHRTSKMVREFLQEKDFKFEKFENRLMGITGNVGLMAWLYAWQVLGIKDIVLVGFDHLYRPETLVWEMNREVFNEIIFDYCPKDVNTWVDYHYDWGFRLKPDKRPMEYPGFSDLQKYLEYRQKRNHEILKGTKKIDF